jgi:hypothetical protein
MDAMLQYVVRIPRRTVILYVRQDNPAATHLYEKYGFTVSEETYQYIVPTDRIPDQGRGGDSFSVEVVPVTEVPPHSRPAFSAQWSQIAKLHDPPKTYVLLFVIEGKQQIGYCRLSPGFPGCFPFELSSPREQLPGALAALKPYLSTEHKILKLTFASAEMAQACDALAFELNYCLYKMAVELKDLSSQ